MNDALEPFGTFAAGNTVQTVLHLQRFSSFLHMGSAVSLAVGCSGAEGGARSCSGTPGKGAHATPPRALLSGQCGRPDRAAQERPSTTRSLVLAEGWTNEAGAEHGARPRPERPGQAGRAFQAG